MRSIFLALALTILISGCRKDGPGGNKPGASPDFTTIPPPSPVNTQIEGYVTNDQNQPHTNPHYFYLAKGDTWSSPYTVMGNGIFNTPAISVDQYRTRTLVETGSWDYLITEKTFPLTTSFRNYVRIKVLNRSSIGVVRNDAGGTFPLPNGGSISFGINSLYQTPTAIYPGYFGPEITSGIYCTYLDPEHKDFAVRLPSYLAGDDEGKRWFLKSYGAIAFTMYTNGLTGDNVDFYNGGKADLKLPIPASLQSNAPDSVNAWQLNKGTWIKAGWAIKQGNFYTARIGKVDAWTFAQPVKGVYLNINLRTDSNAIVTNTAIRIRSNNRVIAESRTDADGNAVCFVPTHEALTAEVVPEERIFSNNTYSFNLGTINEASTKTLKLANNTPELSTIFANVLNCNGQPLANGMAKITFNTLGFEYLVPVKNGRIAVAMWLYGTNNGIKVQITDNATGNQGELNRLVLFNGNMQHVNLYTCQDAALLYNNFVVDEKLYSFKDDAGAANVYLKATKSSQYSPVTIHAISNNMGLKFTSSGIYMSTITSGNIEDLVVNGLPCTVDLSVDPFFSITRYDAALNGYIEGCVIFYYKDNANVRHRLQANFKVKRMF